MFCQQNVFMSGTVPEMGGARFVACALLLLCPLALSRHDDDFAFDNSDEFQVRILQTFIS